MARTLPLTTLAASTLAASLSALLLAACAEGSSLEGLAGAGGGLSAGSGGGAGASGSGGDDGPTASTSRASSGAGPASSAASGGDGGAAGGGSGEGGAGEGGAGSTSSTASSTGSGQTCDFTAPNDCAGAENLGAVAGDEDGAAISVQGTTSKWFEIWVEERSSGISETDLSYSVSLTSPPGMNYDLVVHEGPQDGGVNCGAAPKQGQSDGTAEVVSASWDDDQGFGGESDSMWLSIEVRHVSGEACDLNSRWTLSIQGYP